MLMLSSIFLHLSLYFSPFSLLFFSITITRTSLSIIYIVSFLHTLSFPFISFRYCAVRFLQSPNLFLRVRVSAGASRRFRCQWLRSRRRRASRLPCRHMQGRRHRSGSGPQGSAAASAAA